MGEWWVVRVGECFEGRARWGSEVIRGLPMRQWRQARMWGKMTLRALRTVLT